MNCICIREILFENIKCIGPIAFLPERTQRDLVQGGQGGSRQVFTSL